MRERYRRGEGEVMSLCCNTIRVAILELGKAKTSKIFANCNLREG